MLRTLQILSNTEDVESNLVTLGISYIPNKNTRT